MLGELDLSYIFKVLFYSHHNYKLAVVAMLNVYFLDYYYFNETVFLLTFRGATSISLTKSTFQQEGDNVEQNSLNTQWSGQREGVKASHCDVVVMCRHTEYIYRAQAI